MNFSVMPELGWPNAYFACLTLMAVIATGELWMFYRRGWFE
jgi:Mg2+ and Co2+ transporter CorA